MFKWIKGFVSGAFLIGSMYSICLLLLYVDILKDLKSPSARRTEYFSKYQKEGDE